MIETYRGESFQFASFTEADCHSSSDTKHEQHFTGMAQRLARGAHNSEVTRSKRVAGIHSNSAALQKQSVIVQATLNLSTFSPCSSAAEQTPFVFNTTSLESDLTKGRGIETHRGHLTSHRTGA